MSEAAPSIRKGLSEAVAYAKGRSPKKDYRVHVPEHVDVKAIRVKLGMTQQAFAARFRFSINTLWHWEQGKREPEGPTRAYVLVINRAPAAVQRALLRPDRSTREATTDVVRHEWLQSASVARIPTGIDLESILIENGSMKTTVDIPEDELKDAMRFTKAKTKREAVVKVLEDF